MEKEVQKKIATLTGAWLMALSATYVAGHFIWDSLETRKSLHPDIKNKDMSLSINTYDQSIILHTSDSLKNKTSCHGQRYTFSRRGLVTEIDDPEDPCNNIKLRNQILDTACNAMNEASQKRSFFGDPVSISYQAKRFVEDHCPEIK